MQFQLKSQIPPDPARNSRAYINLRVCSHQGIGSRLLFHSSHPLATGGLWGEQRGQVKLSGTSGSWRGFQMPKGILLKVSGASC